MLQLLYGDSLPIVFSALLRNMLLPTEGHELYVADFSKIEVAVLWWLADNAPGLKILTSGKDPYIYMAAANTGRKYEEIPDEGDDRQLGKAQVLGCGFGMGPPKFQKTAWDMYRLKLTLEQAQFAVSNYRQANAAVPALWKAYERAAIEAVETGRVTHAGKCRFFVQNKFLWIELPSGRRLAYREPQIAWRESEYGPRKTLEFWAVNSKTKKWALERTWGGTLTENIVQATARDLMMPAMVRLEKSGYKALLMVHDEGITEKPIGKGSIEEFVKIMCEPPPWAPGLPLEAKGWKGPRYRK
jgi:DNA polymerase